MKWFVSCVWLVLVGCATTGGPAVGEYGEAPTIHVQPLRVQGGDRLTQVLRRELQNSNYVLMEHMSFSPKPTSGYLITGSHSNMGDPSKSIQIDVFDLQQSANKPLVTFIIGGNPEREIAQLFGVRDPHKKWQKLHQESKKLADSF